MALSTLHRGCVALPLVTFLAMGVLLSTPAHAAILGNLNSVSHTTSPGFDACSAPPTSTMQAWWNTSPYKWVGIYIGGLNRSCKTPPTASWVTTVNTIGWGFLPIYVGLQSPCINPAYGDAAMSSNAGTASGQGRSEADDAATAAQQAGLGAGAIIYNDMEYYDANATCNTAVLNYFNGWDQELHAKGYSAGGYIAGGNAAIFPGASITQPDDMWVAGGGYASPTPTYNNACTPYGISSISDNYLHGHRLYQEPVTVNGTPALGHSETWNGVTLPSVDVSCADGDVTGFASSATTNTRAPVVVRNADGRLEAFQVGANGALYHSWQTMANGGWYANWVSLGGNWPQSRPSVALDANNQLEVVMRGLTGNIYVATQQGGWSGWMAVDPTFTAIGDPTVLRNADGRLEIFAVGAGADHALWHNWQGTPGVGNWQAGWASMGGQWPSGTPAGALDGNNQLEVFMRGTTLNLYVITQNSGWGGWNAIDPRFTAVGDPTVARNSDGRLEIFAVGNGADHALWHNYQTVAGVGNWLSGWAYLGGQWPTGTPSVARDATNQLQVFMRGATLNIYVNTQSGGWSGWNAVDARFTALSDPAVAPNGDGRLEIFAIGNGSDHALWHNYQTVAGIGNWLSGWASLGGYWPS